MRGTRVRYVRWSSAAVVLVTLGGTLGFVPHIRAHVQRYGWLSVVPTRALPWLLPLDQPAPAGFWEFGPIGEELENRFSNWSSTGLFGPHKSDMDDFISVLNRMCKGVPFARPQSERWLNAYFDPLRTWPRRLAERNPAGGWRMAPAMHNSISPGETSAELTAAIDAIDEMPFLTLGMRTRVLWPYGHEVYINTPVFVGWHRPPFDVRQELSVSVNGGAWTRQKVAGWGALIGLVGDATMPNPTKIEARVEVYRVLAENPSERKLMGEYRDTLLVHFAPTLADVMTEVSDPDLDTLLSDGWLTRGRWNRGAYLPRGAIDGTRFADIALVVCQETLCDGVVVARSLSTEGPGSLYWERGFIYENGYSPHALMGLREAICEAYKRADSQQPDDPCYRWTIRVKSLPVTALRVLDADRYWVGEFEIPEVR